MSIGSVFKSVIKFVFGSKAAQDVAEVAISDTMAAVAVLKQTRIGASVANLISLFETKSLSNAEKFEGVVTQTLPLIVTLLSAQGRKATLDEVESIGRSLVQTIFNDVKSSKSGSVAQQIIALAKSLF